MQFSFRPFIAYKLAPTFKMELKSHSITFSLAIILLSFISVQCASSNDILSRQKRKINTQLLSKKVPASPVVQTEAGSIQGRILHSRLGKPFFAYLGIPYAEPPVGELRFQPPQPSKIKWEGVQQLTHYGSMCLQYDIIMGGRVSGDEDCLTLNVYVPETEKKNLKVIFWIHGGGFVSGSGMNDDPKYLMDDEVIIVTANYRLGILGFMNTQDESITGNMGLKDQNLALRWIQKNIANFGGDPKDVTLWGHSSGAIAAHLHVLSKASKGLFSKAIFLSGNALMPIAITTNPAERVKVHASLVGCNNTKIEDTVKCLKNLDGKKLVMPHALCMSPVFYGQAYFGPSLEATNNKGAFITKAPEDIIKSGDFSKIPLIFAVAPAEGAVISARVEAFDDVRKTLSDFWDYYAPRILRYNPSKESMAKELRVHYMGDEKTDIGADLGPLTQMLTDALFIYSTEKSMQLHAKYSPTRGAILKYMGSISMYPMLKALDPRRAMPGEWQLSVSLGQDLFERKVQKRMPSYAAWGPVHGDYMIHFFTQNSLIEMGKDSADFEMSKIMIQMVMDFAKEPKNVAVNNVTWPPVKDDKSVKYMLLDKKPQLVDSPYGKVKEYYDKLRLY